MVVQYKGDGTFDPHSIYRQLDAVKYQYGCFVETFVKRGVATIPAAAPLGTPPGGATGTYWVPLYWSTWFSVGAVGEIGTPWSVVPMRP